MATALGPTNLWKAPFWGKTSNYTGGRDPLGLQTTSVSAYTRLLPGITNVTNRVRYWSFYCWLISMYSERIHRTGHDRIVNFIRRGEFTLAVAIDLVAPEETSVSGKDRARKAAQELPVDLEKYADKSVQGITRYWKLELGAFGQYFSGIMAELGLIEKNEHGIFVCTDKTKNESYSDNLEVDGVDLAKAFRESIGQELENRFFDAIEKGTVESTDLIDFGEAMNLSAIRPDSTEWILIKKIITGRDLPGSKPKDVDTFHRLDTIRLFIEFCRCEIERPVLDFPFWMEERSGTDATGSETDVSLGWFYYALNEHWHLANEHIFQAFLETIQQNDFKRLDWLVPEFVQAIVKSANDEMSPEKFSSVQEWSTTLDAGQRSPADGSPASRALAGFKSFLNLRNKYQSELDRFILFGQRLKIERHGNFAHGLRTVEAQFHLPLYDFFEWYLLRQIINRHLYVAMDKFVTTGVNTQKFRLEEGTLIFIKSIGVHYTNPRVTQLALFLRDLKVLDKDFYPTDLSTQFLEPENPGRP